VIDYRIYDPDGDGLSKLDHVLQMLENLVYQKRLPFSRVLMDSRYATKKLMQYIDKIGKIYYCPLKRNRLVDDSGGASNYKHIESLSWTESEIKQGKIIKIKTFPQSQRVKLFRVIISTDKTEYIATKNLNQNSTDNTQEVCTIRWKIEQFHRELKQLTGIESCQCRKARMSEKSHRLCYFSLA
jgi:Transposase DDE domain